MLLAVDMGNTDVVFALHDGDVWKKVWRIPTEETDHIRERFPVWMEEEELSISEIQTSILSSVVPKKREVLIGILETLLKKAPIVMGPDLYKKFPILIDNPNEIGADLLANAICAYHKFQKACVVVDFGTALSFTVVSEEGKILGVSIAPGLSTAMKALFMKTAQLFEIPLELPETVIGKNTQHALQSGILLGYVGLVHEILDKIEEEVGQKPKIAATGGLVRVLTPLHPRFDSIDPMHTLEGLRIIAYRYAGE